MAMWRSHRIENKKKLALQQCARELYDGQVARLRLCSLPCTKCQSLVDYTIQKSEDLQSVIITSSPTLTTPSSQHHSDSASRFLTNTHRTLLSIVYQRTMEQRQAELPIELHQYIIEFLDTREDVETIANCEIGRAHV